MPQTVLQGPDGQPARDMSGMELTMEEMLRRRGIVRMGNNVSMLDPNAAAASTNAAPNANSAAAAAMKNRAGVPSIVDASTAAVPAATDPSAATGDPATDVDAAVAALDQTNADPATAADLEKVGLLAAGAGAAYAAYRMMKGRGGADAAAVMPDGTPRLPSNSGIIDGEYTEVKPQEAIAGRQSVKSVRTGQAAARIEGSPQARLPAPNKALPAPPPSRRAAAEALIARAAQGQANDVGTIAAEAAPNVVREAPDAGLARTLGLAPEVSKMLKENPALLKVLTRIR